MGSGWTHCQRGERVTENPKTTVQRIQEYIKYQDVKSLKSQGAITCKLCTVLFMPANHKKWTQDGYCSIRCSEYDGVSVSESDKEKQKVVVEQKAGSMIHATCPQGHEFKVLKTFIGIQRPCQICGAATLIKE